MFTGRFSNKCSANIRSLLLRQVGKSEAIAERVTKTIRSNLEVMEIGDALID